MKFSVGIFDDLFGKKVELEIPDKDGNIIKRTVTKKWLEKMQATGKIKINNDVVRVHMSDPMRADPYIVEWAVGKDVSQEAVDRYRDKETGDLYVLIAYVEGERKTMIVTKEYWGNVLKKFEEI